MRAPAPLLLALACVLVGPPVRSQEDERPSTFPEDAIDLHGGHHTTLQSGTLLQYCFAFVGSRSIRCERAERADRTAPWEHREESEYSLPYYLTGFASREGGDELFLCGMTPDGSTIIERWRFPVPDGRWVVRYPGPAPPIGTPAGAFVPTVVVEGGGAWEWGSDDPVGELRPPTRTVVYEGSAGPFTAIAVDPEGRFLVMSNHSRHSLDRIVLGASPIEVETLFEEKDYPALGKIASIEVLDFGTEGRKILLRGNGYGANRLDQVWGIIGDPENDGILDSLEFLSSRAFAASPYSVWEDWRLFWRPVEE